MAELPAAPVKTGLVGVMAVEPRSNLVRLSQPQLAFEGENRGFEFQPHLATCGFGRCDQVHAR